MRILGKEIVLFSQPGPLDQREVHWRGADLWRLVGAYFGYSITAAILLLSIGVRWRDDSASLRTVGEALVLAALFCTHSNHRFWPDAAYWQLRRQDFKRHWRQGVIWGVGTHLAGVVIRMATALLAAMLLRTDLSQVESNNPLANAGLGIDWLLFAITAVLLAPLMEELFTRGMLYGWLRRQVGVKKGLIISSLLFAVLHFNGLGLISFFVTGLLFGALYERTGSLAPGMIAHATHNLISVVLALALAGA
ncbi:MAG: CPBP family intramembrane glutamic endopeptidase [Bacillota bacterium]|jgi:membrane protease YdiL (CAAX protease family)